MIKIYDRFEFGNILDLNPYVSDEADKSWCFIYTGLPHINFLLPKIDISNIYILHSVLVHSGIIIRILIKILLNIVIYLLIRWC